MLEAGFEAVTGIAFGLAEVVHQFALYALLTAMGGIIVSIPVMAVGAAYVGVRAMIEKPKR